jgi:hypothetical protein
MMSDIIRTSIGEWDELGGLLNAGELAPVPGWDVIPVTGGQEGAVTCLPFDDRDRSES